jgi:hypothetical protein
VPAPQPRSLARSQEAEPHGFLVGGLQPFGQRIGGSLGPAALLVSRCDTSPAPVPARDDRTISRRGWASLTSPGERILTYRRWTGHVAVHTASGRTTSRHPRAALPPPRERILACPTWIRALWIGLAAGVDRGKVRTSRLTSARLASPAGHTSRHPRASLTTTGERRLACRTWIRPT